MHFVIDGIIEDPDFLREEAYENVVKAASKLKWGQWLKVRCPTVHDAAKLQMHLAPSGRSGLNLKTKLRGKAIFIGLREARPLRSKFVKAAKPKRERRRTPSDFNWEQLKKQYEVGISTYLMAKKYGISSSTISVKLRSLGVQMRGQDGKPKGNIQSSGNGSGPGLGGQVGQQQYRDIEVPADVGRRTSPATTPMDFAEELSYPEADKQ